MSARLGDVTASGSCRREVLLITGIVLGGAYGPAATKGHEDADYDVFISYGWSGVPNQDDGDRGWVGTLQKVLEPQLASNLARRARIFLDVEQMQSGELSGLLEDALASSTLFLSILTPGRLPAEVMVPEGNQVVPRSR